MNRLLSLLLMTLAAVSCSAYETQYQRADSLKVMELLNGAKRQKAGTNYIIYFARQMRGLPYVAHTLEVNKTEKLVINLRQLDCTTYVENVLALNLCVANNAYTFKAFCDNLRQLRYRDGAEPHYVKRLHYFTDWIDDNTKMGLCREVQQPNPPFSKVQAINVYFMSKNPAKYKMLKENPDYVPQIAKTETELNKRSYRYIPKAAVKNTKLLRSVIHDGDIIAITTTLGGLDIQHIGFAVWHTDGLHLLNASSLRHKVVEEPQTLYKYLSGKKTMTGIRIIRLSK